MGIVVTTEAVRLYTTLSAGASLPSGISLLHIGYTNTRCSPPIDEAFIDTSSPDTIDSANLKTVSLVSCIYTLYPRYVVLLNSHMTFTATLSSVIDDVQLMSCKMTREAENNNKSIVRLI